jgi:hypothetical protein
LVVRDCRDWFRDCPTCGFAKNVIAVIGFGRKTCVIALPASLPKNVIARDCSTCGFA